MRAFHWYADDVPVDLDVNFPEGVGGVLVNAYGGKVTVMYSDTGNLPSDCPPTAEVGWKTTSTIDNGASWFGRTTIAHTTHFSWCAASGAVGNGFRAFGFTRDPGGEYWASINATPGNVLVFHSPLTTGAGWTQDLSLHVGPSALFPAIAADTAGRIGVAYYRSDPSDTQMALFFIARPNLSTGPGGWSLPTPVTPFFAVPPPAPAPDRTFLGDYLIMSSVDPSRFPSGGATFLPGWSDTVRSGGGFPEVATSLTTVAP